MLLTLAPASAFAHAGLIRSDPVAGAALGASPSAVRLTFTEQPQGSLSRLRVLDARGRPVQTAPAAATGSSIAVPVPRLARGVYTVDWRIVSAVDGHASFGKFKFGIGVAPPKGATSAAKPATSKLELLARWILLSGLVLLVGSAVAGAAGYGGPRRTNRLLSAAGLLVAVVGLLLLAEAQRRAAHSSLSALLDTPVGGALIGRAVAIVAAGVALLVAPALAALPAAAAIVVHVAEGHAAAGSWSTAVTVIAQSAHFLAVGIWIGGLAALLVGNAGRAGLRRFSRVALVALITVVVTGTVRAIDELTSLGDLTSTGYGRAILAKILLVTSITAAAALGRRRIELGLASVAIATAALLGTLSPPVASSSGAPPGLSASGSAGGISVKLSTASAEPGPNTFTARVDGVRRVALRFVPLDDPGVRPTTLALRPSGPGTYEGSGPNLKFDGRWRVEVRAGAIVVPLEFDVPGPAHRVSVLRVPGKPPEYTMEIGTLGLLRITPSPERAGPSTVTVDAFDELPSELSLSGLVVTAAQGNGPERQLPARRLAPNRFATRVMLAKGRNTITVVAHAHDGGQRLRGVFELDVP